MVAPFRRLWVAAILFAAFTVGCEGPPPEVYVAASGRVSASAVPIGTNEVGEPCRYQLTSANLTGVPSRREAFLFCGDWEQPSGHIAELGEGSDPPSSPPWRAPGRGALMLTNASPAARQPRLAFPMALRPC